MKQSLQLFLAIFILFSSSCKNEENKIRNIKPENLKEQTFIIKPGIDTVLVSEKGTKIFINKNAFSIDNAEVEINLQEALTLSEMLNAGLTTTSRDKILSTGGMIYISAKNSNGKELKLENPIKIQIQTNIYDNEMQLFKGSINNNGIDWQLIGELEADSNKLSYLNGEEIFKTSCAACHKIGERLIGPDLSYVTERRSKKWLFDFTRNSIAMIENGDKTAECLFRTYNKIIMPPQDISEKQLIDVYNYIETLGIKHGKEPYDSCNAKNAIKTLLDINLIDSLRKSYDTTSRILNSNLNRSTNTTIFSNGRTYTFTINEFGWYNCDRFLESPGNVIPQITINSNIQIISQYPAFVIIPKLKAIIPVEVEEGEITNSWTQFRFPKNAEALIVFENEDRKYYFTRLILTETPVTIKVDNFTSTLKDIEKELD